MTIEPVLAVLPLGATEQHGAHLPLQTDTLLATAAAHALAAADCLGHRDARVLPALAYGASGEHQSFPGTVSMGTEALAQVVLELGRSVSTWATRFVVVNGHGGNLDALRRAVPQLRREGRDAAWLPCRTSEHAADTHAGHAETSLMLHLHPDLVRVDRAAPGCLRPLPEILPALRAGGVAAVSPSGVLGDPTTATSADGCRLWEELLADARARLTRWQPGEADGMLR
ncbi:mycofactocin biosynthesis peptidyl-dipeptidase MftE [Rhodococcus sp. IEGM 1408]|uniref:mycofactocin biosynthesis peptidyl-dipeptidase MftE n=1 Tax=Rhodococcus sp. IEGM 1408 TaxID=3082220 RepID=UPI002953F8CC|nr:mycofactocin biosynthesis peptidyl-dipeptidase MftE [Rhodococcus sp. IEGM 1408]MDV8001177.1 mycofactocin biosynthesis peptidyl-dipeptidase MftE [Rhodococcus sp. IEGM 1408]